MTVWAEPQGLTDAIPEPQPIVAGYDTQVQHLPVAAAHAIW